MKRFDNSWYFPDHEEHLQDWMGTVGDRHPVSGRLIYQGAKYRAALKYTTDRRRAIDIGAHVGLWSYQMMHDFIKVEAFEPMPDHAACWEKNVGRKTFFRNLYPVALGADQRTVHIRTRTPNSQDSQDRRNAGSSRGQQLPNFVEHASHCLRPDPATSTPGGKSSRSTPVLNPLFVELLMGWPIGMTDFDCAVTGFPLWLRRMRSELSRLCSTAAEPTTQLAMF